jgi:hypothetical protein
MPLIQFKVINRCSAPRRQRVLDEVVAHGGANPRPAFPGNIPDADLRAIFMADVATPAAATALVEWLRKKREIEFAEVAPVRTVRG